MIALPKGCRVLGTLHLADLMRDPKMMYPTQLDWLKVSKYLKGEWPKEIPPYTVAFWDGKVVGEWVTEARWAAPFVAVDTEYIYLPPPTPSRLTIVGMGYPGMGRGLQIGWERMGPAAREETARHLRYLFAAVPVVFQNAMADVPVLEDNCGVRLQDYFRIDDTMLEHAALWSEWPHRLEFLASLYGKYPKLKHLSSSNPSLYNWGDVIDTISAHQALQGELGKDPQSRDIYELQSRAVTVVPETEVVYSRMRKGIRVNKERVEPARILYEVRLEEAMDVARAYTGLPEFNLGSSSQLLDWLVVEEEYKPRKHKKTKRLTIDQDAIADILAADGFALDPDEEYTDAVSFQRIEDGSNPVLESRVLYGMTLQAKAHYIDPLYEWAEYDKMGRPKKKKGRAGIRDRIYPQFHIHAQASGRWSTTNPPLAQLPADLRDIICPDPGQVWLSWDYSQQELRVIGAESGSKKIKAIFDEGWDIHTLNACDLFGLPYPPNRKNPNSPECAEWAATVKWQGADDPRRRFSKVFVYRLNYGGDPERAGDVPGAKALGLKSRDLVEASRRYLAADPELSRWRNTVAAEALRTRMSRTFAGRRRVLMGDRKSIVRVAYNHPLQGGGADIFNSMIVLLRQKFSQLSFVFGMHDSMYWSCPAEEADSLIGPVEELAQQAWMVNGTAVPMPTKVKVIYPPEEMA